MGVRHLIYFQFHKLIRIHKIVVELGWGLSKGKRPGPEGSRGILTALSRVRPVRVRKGRNEREREGGGVGVRVDVERLDSLRAVGSYDKLF